jgi:hypothetical protein
LSLFFRPRPAREEKVELDDNPGRDVPACGTAGEGLLGEVPLVENAEVPEVVEMNEDDMFDGVVPLSGAGLGGVGPVEPRLS